MTLLFKANGAPCQVAINATSLLTPLTGIGQYVKNLLLELERSQDVSVNKFYSGKWSREIYNVNAVEPSNQQEQKWKAWVRNNLPMVRRVYCYILQQRFDAGQIKC